MSSIRKALRFFLTTVASFFLNLGTTILLHEYFGVPVKAAYAIALGLVFVTNFLMMRHYIYQPSSDSASRQFLTYTLAALAFRGSEYVAFVVLEALWLIDYRVLVLGISVVATIAKFFVYRVIFEGLKKPEAPWPELVSNS